MREGTASFFPIDRSDGIRIPEEPNKTHSNLHIGETSEQHRVKQVNCSVMVIIRTRGACEMRLTGMRQEWLVVEVGGD